VRPAAAARLVLASAALLLLLVPLAACGGGEVAGVVVGSSAQTTKTFALSGFTKVQVDQKFSVNVQRGNASAVSVTVNENLVQYLKVEVKGDTLYLGLDPGKTYSLTGLTADVTLPQLDAVTVGGASDAFVDGFTSEGLLALKVSGASKLSLAGMKAKDASFGLSGGSGLGGDLTLTGDLDGSAAGASQAVLTGACRDVRLDVSGASVVSLKGFKATNTDVSVSGASQTSVYAAGTIDVQASGASTFVYYGPGKLGTTDISGASQISHITE
jgi:hypothetical protein